jgi:tetratricopeptide (TPR) repeat protein/CHAT domain-containing protein
VSARSQDLNEISKQFNQHRQAGRYGEAERLGKQALDLCETRFGRNRPDCVGILNNLAIVSKSQGKYEDAERLYQRALAILQKARGANDPNVGSLLSNLAFVYQLQGKYAEAERLAQRALTIQEKALGESNPRVAATLNDLGAIYRSQGKYVEAERLYQRALAIRERVLGMEHPDVAETLNNLAILYGAQGKYADAERLYGRALAIRERALGANHPDVATTLGNLAIVYRSQGNYANAERLYRRALAIREQVLGMEHPEVAQTLNNLAILYDSQGKYAEAERLYRRTLAIEERALGASHPNLATTLNNLAVLYKSQGEYADAERLYQRALAIRERVLGMEHPDVAETLNNLAILYGAQGKYADAERLYGRALAIRERALGANHPDVAMTLSNLATVFQGRGKYADAEELYKRVLATLEKTLGASHPEVAPALNNLAVVYDSQGKYADAERLHQRALAIREQALGPKHPDLGPTLINLARLSLRRGDSQSAVAYSRRATAAVIAHAEIDVSDTGHSRVAGGLIEQRADYFRDHVSALALAVQQKIGSEPAAGREAAEMAQWAMQSSAADAVRQMAVRFASGSGPLAPLVRERQDLVAAWREKDKALLATLSKWDGRQDRATVDAMRRQITEIEEKLTVIDARLNQEFPNYVALAKPRPVQVEEVQKLLEVDEGLVFWLPGHEESYVFAVTREGFEWKSLPISETALAGKVALFRRGLDVQVLDEQLDVTAKTGAKPDLFDLALAHDLYGTLIGPIEKPVKHKRHLIVVPAGPLTALPFHLLVTEKATAPQLKDTLKFEDLATYRDAAWLIKRQAVTMLPSVASLKALRVFTHSEQGMKPLVGFGDPVFTPDTGSPQVVSPEQRGKVNSATASRKIKSGVNTRAYSEFWKGGEVDRDKLARALPPLPETADELKTVARELGAPMTDIYLGRDASEATVKRIPLANYRVVYFATHGLVAGDVKGLGEPSLALTLPSKPSAFDDGLLTASEVAQLKLNADWVVLSACNTIAGDKPGAEALSGLARAFFYAGARALLVSHWSVETDAATQLTTRIFAIMKTDPMLGRAEALRRSMLDYLNNRSEPKNAYPAFWGPFSLVGEGASGNFSKN